MMAKDRDRGMNRYTALIRGINVGGKNLLPMKDLTEILESIGCRRVKSYIQSGNVVFDSAFKAARLTEEIADGISARRGFKPHVLVLEKSEFEMAIANNPFMVGEPDYKALHLGFLDSIPPNPDLQRLESLKAPSERFELIGRVFYLHAPDGIGRSKLAANSEKALGVPMTDRNWKTVLKIMSMLEDQDGR
jgi:uncharacterized protein (DUF1697 family)